jgi:hypothetical protein
MKLTRQHFELIAETLRDSKPEPYEEAGPLSEIWDRDELDTWTNVVDLFADRLAITNPSFDAERFVQACGR